MHTFVLLQFFGLPIHTFMRNLEFVAQKISDNLEFAAVQCCASYDRAKYREFIVF